MPPSGNTLNAGLTRYYKYNTVILTSPRCSWHKRGNPGNVGKAGDGLQEDYNLVGLTSALDMPGEILKGLLCSVLKFII